MRLCPPDGIETIENDVFRDCTSLRSLDIPGSITFLGIGAVRGCTALERVTFKNSTQGGIEDIPAEAFYGCANLKEVTLPEGIGIIERSAFYRCTSLEKIVIPDGTAIIDLMAFWRCTSLTRIHMPASVSSIVMSFMKDDCPDLTFCTPEDSYAAQWARTNGFNVEAEQ